MLRNQIILFFIVSAAIIALFEWLPIIQHDRYIVPESVYVGVDCDCDCIRDSRPWYSTFNYWFWFWVLFVPIMIFSVKPASPTWKKVLRTIIVIIASHHLIFLKVYLTRDIRDSIFSVDHSDQNPILWDNYNPQCINISDTGEMVHAHLLGWLYGLIYAGWWLIIWKQYHLKRTKLIDQTYKHDWFNKLTIIGSVVLTVLIYCYFTLLFALLLWHIHFPETFPFE